MNAFNGLAMSGTASFDLWVSVIVLFAAGLLAFWLAVFLFSWDSRNSDRRGHPRMALLYFLPFALSLLLG